MSEKAPRGSHPEGQLTGQAEPCFASLPDAVVSHIAHFTKQLDGGHPLMQVSRSCRDAVLSNCTSVTIHRHYQQQPESFSPAPDARLLHRVCCQARPGLSLRFPLWGDHSDSLAQLLLPGVECGGWKNVHKLEVFASDSPHLFIPPFPALREIKLLGVQLGGGAMFSMLAAQAACPLTTIFLRGCDLNEAAVEVAATALAQLPSLKACTLLGGTVPLRVTSQLTALTHLGGVVEVEEVGAPADTQLMKAVSRNAGLQSLSVTLARAVPLTAEMLQCLANRCANLTQIDLTICERIDDEVLNILIQHGTNITGVTFGWLVLTRSRADSTVRWQRLQLTDESSVLDGLAYLPLKSVQKLDTVTEEGTLHLPLVRCPDLTRRLRQAVSNLVSSPAWKKQPAARILVYSMRYEGLVGVAGAGQAQLLSALSPLGGPHLQHLGISMNIKFRQQEVQALGSLGSTLRSLSLRRGVIKPSFWSALSQHLPRLQELGLMYRVEVSSEGITGYLRTLTQPLTLYISEDLGYVGDSLAADLTEHIDAGQLQNVSVQREWPADESDFPHDYEVEDSDEDEWGY